MPRRTDTPRASKRRSRKAKQEEDDDPFAALMALATSFKSGGLATSRAAAQPVAPVAPAPVQPEAVEVEAEAYEQEAHEVAYYDEQDDYAASEDGAPDIETIEVPEAVALADDLDIPEVAFEQDKPSGSAYDNLDAEFASLLSDMTSPEAPAPEQPKAAAPVRAAAPVQESYRASRGAYAAPAEEPVDEDQEQAYAAAAAAAAAAAVAGTVYATNPSRQPAAAAPVMQATHGYGEAEYRPAAARTQQNEPAVNDEFDFDQDVFHEALDEEAVAPAYAAERRRLRLNSRGYVVAALVGGVALLGGVSIFALSSGDGSTGPVLVKAEEGPIKVKPENPGGATVRNQQNMVYETVARAQGAGEAAPVQEKLVSTVEEPVDVQSRVAAQQQPAAQPDMAEGSSAIAETGVTEAEQETGPSIAQLAGVEDPQIPVAAPSADEMTAAPQAPAKAEDRITPADVEDDDPVASEIAAVAPRKVRTLVVRPDGTLVPREAPAASAAEQPAQNAAPAQSADAVPAAAQPGAAPAAPQQMAALEQAAAGGAEGQTPALAPVAPSRPADQPVDIVGAVKAENQVAALNGNAAAASGEWSVQIASQPSEAAARASFEDLSRRYGSVLNGRNVNIVKADIEGKGTFWRVRIPAETRGEAVNLCNSYKSAGGNCFVSR